MLGTVFLLESFFFVTLWIGNLVNVVANHDREGNAIIVVYGS